MKTLIKNGIITTENTTTRADILIANGVVSSVGYDLPEEGATILDASGMLILPGGVDAHTHITLNLDAARGTDTYFSGTVSAASGGTTTIIDHLSFMPKGRSLADHIELYRALAQGKSVVDYMFHGLAQGPQSIMSEDVSNLPKEGFSSIKAYMTYDNFIDDENLLALLRRTKELGLLLAVHAEDDSSIQHLRTQFRSEGKGDPIWHALSRPAESEAKAVTRLLHYAAKAGDAPVYIVHLSSAAGLKAVQKAKRSGQKNIYVETCTQYLCLTDELYANSVEGLLAIMSPPLRKQEDIDALWEGIKSGDIDVIATDHCTFTVQDKMAGLHDFMRCPGGAPGIEERFSLIYSEGVAKNKITIERFVECISTNPAKLFGLYPKKGSLSVGADADIVIFDPSFESTLSATDLHGKSDYSLYEDMLVKGKIEYVFLRGSKVVEKGNFIGTCGMGSKVEPQSRLL